MKDTTRNKNQKKDTHKNPRKNSAKESSGVKELDTTGLVAHHYGFNPVASPKINLEDKTKAKEYSDGDDRVGETEERLAVIRLFDSLAFGALPQPPMLYFKKPLPGGSAKKRSSVEMCGLEILNVSRPAAEALIVKTAWEGLAECGCVDMRLEINSVGDKESMAKFERELHAYFRKNIGHLPAEFREKFKTNNLNILAATEKECETLRNEAPKPLSSLSEASREHFKEVLEFLESAEIMYQINSCLLPNTQYASHTVFEIKGKIQKNGPEIVLASGGRYNYLAKKVGYKKDVACCGATVFYPKKVNVKKKLMNKIKLPRFYLVQLGSMAKLQTLPIIEVLRRENIPVHYSLVKENIGGQLASAEYLKVSHLLIIGQKEALENSVMVRSTGERVQETVFVTQLPTYLKKILRG